MQLLVIHRIRLVVRIVADSRVRVILHVQVRNVTLAHWQTAMRVAVLI